MNLSSLSINKWFYQFTEFCIDWFMNFFADPDYYWTLETYPGSDQKSNSSDKLIFREKPLFAKVKKTLVRILKMPVIMTNIRINNLSSIKITELRFRYNTDIQGKFFLQTRAF